MAMRGRKVNPSNVYQGSNGTKTVFVIATEGNKQARRLCAQKIGCCEYELVFCMKSTAERALQEQRKHETDHTQAKGLSHRLG